MAFPKLASCLALAGFLCSAAVQAEQLAIEGVYAARTDAARGITDIAIESIRGREGYSLESAITDELDAAHIHGEPFFRLSSVLHDESEPVWRQARLRGYADSRVFDVADGVIEHTTCLRKEVAGEGKKKTCVESITEVYECRRLHVEFRPEVTLINAQGTLYQRADRFQKSERYCADNSHVPSAAFMLDPMVARFARLVRLDIAPEQRFGRFRIFESRSGLEGKDRSAFKRAIKLTKTDPDGACALFEDILVRNPFQRSTLFNVALCREAAGELELAAEAYSHLVRISDKSQFRAGMARVENRFTAREQIAMLGENSNRLASAEVHTAIPE